MSALLDRVTAPLDLDREIERASQRRFVRDPRTGLVIPQRVIRGGSGLTGTWAETIYASSAAGTAKNTFTTEATINDTAGMGPYPVLPPEFFLPGQGVGRTLRIVARGVTSTTSTAPTWQHFCRFNSGAPAAPPTGPNVGSTPASAALCALSQTNMPWEYECDVTMSAMGAAGANSTLRGLGVFTAQTASTPTSIAVGIFGGGASPGTVATFDWSATTYITYSVACGTSSASNQVQLLQLIILGLN